MTKPRLIHGLDLIQFRPHDRPNKVKKSPAPLFHAATRRVRDELYQMYAAFVAAFRGGWHFTPM